MTILKNVLRFTGLVIGVPVSLPHKLNVNGPGPVAPHVVLPSVSGFTITADTINVTVTRTTGGATVDVYTEHWHTIEDAEPLPGGIAASVLPFVGGGGGGGGGIGNAVQSISAGTTLATGPTVVFANSNNVTFGVDGNTVTASFADPAISAGTQLASTGTVKFADSNGISFGMSNTSQVTASYDAIKSISGGTTQATNGQVVFADSPTVSFGVAGNTMTASVSQSTQSQSTGPSAIAAGTTLASSGTVVFSNANNVTFGMAGNTVTASATVSQSTAPSAISAGTTSASSGTIVFANANNVTFGMAGNTVTASATMSQSTAPSAISAGTTSASSGTIVFSNSPTVTFGMAGNTITGSAAGGGGGIAAISAGTTLASSGTVSFADSNGISFGVDGQTVTASIGFGGGAGFISAYSQYPEMPASFAIANLTVSLQHLTMPSFLTGASNAYVAMALSGASNSTGALTISLGIYTLLEPPSLSQGSASLVSTASRLVSWTSGSVTSASPEQYGGVSGTRYRSIALGAFSFTPGDYLLMWQMRTTNNGTWTIFGKNPFTLVGADNGNSGGWEAGYAVIDGLSTATFSTAFPSLFNVQLNSDYNRTHSSAARQPGVVFLAQTIPT